MSVHDTDGLQILSKFRSHKVSHHVTLKKKTISTVAAKATVRWSKQTATLGSIHDDLETLRDLLQKKPLGSGDSYDSAVAENPHRKYLSENWHKTPGEKEKHIEKCLVMG